MILFAGLLRVVETTIWRDPNHYAPIVNVLCDRCYCCVRCSPNGSALPRVSRPPLRVCYNSQNTRIPWPMFSSRVRMYHTAKSTMQFFLNAFATVCIIHPSARAQTCGPLSRAQRSQYLLCLVVEHIPHIPMLASHSYAHPSSFLGGPGGNEATDTQLPYDPVS